MSMAYCMRCDVHFDTDTTEQAEYCGHCERIVPDVDADDVTVSVTIRDLPLKIGGVTVGHYDDLDCAVRIDANNRAGGVVITTKDAEIEIDREGRVYCPSDAGAYVCITPPTDPWRGLAKGIFEAAQAAIDSGRYDTDICEARGDAREGRSARAADLRREIYAL